MDEQAGRRSAYAEVLAGLRDLADNGATERFDAWVDALIAQGRLTEDEASALRYWQRESLRNQADHLVSTASTALDALDLAREQAREATSHAEAIWTARVEPGPVEGAAPTVPSAAPEPSPAVDVPQAPPTGPAPEAVSSATTGAGAATDAPLASPPGARPSTIVGERPSGAATILRSSRGRHRAAPMQPPTMARILDDLRDLPQPPVVDVDPEAPEGQSLGPAPATAAPERLFAPLNVTPPQPVSTTRRIEMPLPEGGFVGSQPAAPEQAFNERDEPPAARRRRLLVAGLTVMGDDLAGRRPAGDDHPEAG